MKKLYLDNKTKNLSTDKINLTIIVFTVQLEENVIDFCKDCEVFTLITLFTFGNK